VIQELLILHIQKQSIGMLISITRYRIGTVNNDHTLSFWDINDNFKFEKVIYSRNDDLIKLNNKNKKDNNNDMIFSL